MQTPLIITGTDRKLTAYWQIGSTNTPVSPSGVVRFRLVSRNKETTYTNVLTADSNHPDADWANAKLILVFPASSTVSIDTQGPAEVELQVDDGGEKLGTFFSVDIVKGNIG